MAERSRASICLLVWVLTTGTSFAISHRRSLIWVQKPVVPFLPASIMGLEGDPVSWFNSTDLPVSQIGAPFFDWEFKGLGFFYRKKMLVWSECKNRKIQAFVLNGSTSPVDIFTGTSSQVNGVTVDWVGGNVYWTDALYNWVVMAPLRPYTTGRVYKIILQQGLDNPHGIAVHPEYNWLMVSDWGMRPRIEHMDLLGNHRKVLVDQDVLQPRGMVIDVVRLKLYWVDSGKGTVESISLRGADHHRTVLRTQPDTRFYGIAYFNNYLFVTDQSHGLLKVIADRPAKDTSFTLNKMPFGIVMYDEGLQPAGSGRCDRYGCEHMCVEDEESGPQCECGEGYDLMDDMKHCMIQRQLVFPVHIYAISIGICTYPANVADMDFTDISFTSQCDLSQNLDFLALTFDARDNLLFYSANLSKSIFVKVMEVGAKGKVLISGTGTVKGACMARGDVEAGLALDWVTGTLFWTDSTKRHIMACRKDGSFQNVILHKDVHSPLGIAVHPSRGKIYWTDIGSPPLILPKVESANMDGSDRQRLKNDGIGQANHLFIDYKTDKLYWADSVLNQIVQFDLNTQDMVRFYKHRLGSFYGLSMYKDYLLWTDRENMNGIHVARLDNGQRVRVVIHPGLGQAADLITVDRQLQPELTSQCPLSGRRGTCSQLCLPTGSQSFTCLCSMGFKLHGRWDCSRDSFARDNFLLVTDAYRRNIYQVKVKNGEVVAMTDGQQHQPIAVAFLPAPSGQGDLLWSDNLVHVIRRQPMGSRFSKTLLRLSEDSVVDGLAVDVLNMLVFYTDSGRQLVAVSSLVESSQAEEVVVIDQGLYSPRDIVVSPSDWKIYWTDWGPNATISQASMTGARRSVLVHFQDTAWPNGLALDTKDKALFWADAYNNQLGRYDLTSGQRSLILQERSGHYFGLFLMGNFLYFTDWLRPYISRLPKQGGTLMQFGNASFSKLYGITGYNSTEHAKVGVGICRRWSKCPEHSVCLPVSASTYSCSCAVGYRQLGNTCRVIPTTTSTERTSKAVTEVTEAVTRVTETSVHSKRIAHVFIHNNSNGTHLKPLEQRMSIGQKGMVVVVVMVGMVLLTAVVVLAVFCYRKRRRSEIAHVRLNEEGGESEMASSPATTRSITPTIPLRSRTTAYAGARSGWKVTYMRRENAENVQIHEESQQLQQRHEDEEERGKKKESDECHSTLSSREDCKSASSDDNQPSV